MSVPKDGNYHEPPIGCLVSEVRDKLTHDGSMQPSSKGYLAGRRILMCPVS
jgi:hypothetical protein